MGVVWSILTKYYDRSGKHMAVVDISYIPGGHMVSVASDWALAAIGGYKTEAWKLSQTGEELRNCQRGI